MRQRQSQLSSPCTYVHCAAGHGRAVVHHGLEPRVDLEGLGWPGGAGDLQLRRRGHSSGDGGAVDFGRRGMFRESWWMHPFHARMHASVIGRTDIRTYIPRRRGRKEGSRPRQQREQQGGGNERRAHHEWFGLALVCGF